MKKTLLLVLASTSSLLAQAPTITAVINTLSPTGSTALCPGVLASVYGTGFGSSASAVTVSVGNQQAYVFTVTGAVTPTQINVQLPFGAAAGPTTVVVTVNGSSSAPFNITLADVAPVLGLYQGFGEFTDPKGNYISSTNLATPGETLSLYPSGLGATNPVVQAGKAPTGITTTVNTPTVTVGGVNAPVIFSGLTSYAGLYQVNFTVPKNVQGTVAVILTIDNVASNSVMLPIQGISAIVSGGSFVNTGTATPGEIVSLFGNGLGSTEQLNTFPSTTVAGVSVTFNGVAAPIFDLIPSAGQINLIVPSETPTTGTVQVQLTTPTFTTGNFPLIMESAVPDMFLTTDPSNAKADIAAAQFANTVWLVVPDSTAMALNIPQNCTASKANPLSICGQPAAPGDYLVLYLTGLGLATPKGDPSGTPLATGSVAPADGNPLYETVATPTVQIGGTPVTVLFSGIAPGTAGEYQIDFQVPTGVTEGNAVPLTVSMPGSTTATATIAVQSR